MTGLAFAPLVYAALISQNYPPKVALVDTTLLTGAHLLSGILFSPDLDIDSAIDNRWGIFWWIWRPYMWVVPHRSRWFSHGLIFPPLFRLLYFGGVLFLCFLGLARALEPLGVIVPDYPDQVANQLLLLVQTKPDAVFFFLLGFVTGGAVHTLADWLVTGGKWYLRRLGFRNIRDYPGHDRTRHTQRSWHRR